MDRRTTTIPRSWAVSVLMGFFFAVGGLVMVGVAMLRQGEDIAEVVQRQRVSDKRQTENARLATIDARERLSEALAQVKRILEESIAAHDKTALANHEEQLHRLADLMGRPLPTTPRPAPQSATTAPRVSASPSPPAAPPSVTTTTRPAHRIPPPPSKPAPQPAPKPTPRPAPRHSFSEPVEPEPPGCAHSDKPKKCQS